MAALVVALISGTVYAQSATTSTTPATPDETKNQNQQINWKTESIGNLRREIKDIQREAKDADVSKGTGFIDKYEACVNTLKGMTGGDNQAFWDKSRDCEDLSRDLEDYMNDFLRPLRRCGEFKDTIRNWKDQLRNTRDQIKQIKRDDPTVDLSKAETLHVEIEQLFPKLEQTLTTCNRDTADDAQDIRQEGDDKFRDLWDILNEFQQKTNIVREKKNLEKNLKDRERQGKDMARELKNALRRLPAGDPLTTQLDTAVASYQTQLESLRQCLANLGANGDLQACQDLNSELDRLCCDPEEGFWSLNNEVNEKGNLAQCQKERPKEHKNNLRQVKDLRREEARLVKQGGAEVVAPLSQCINTYEEALKKAEGLIATDQCNDYWNIFNELEPVGENGQTPPGGCWDLMNRLNRVSDVKRLTRDLEREAKGYEQECNRIKKEAERRGADASNICSIASEFRQAVNDLLAASSSGDVDKVFEINDFSINDLRQRWNESLQYFWEKDRILQSCSGDLDQIEKEINKGEKSLSNAKEIGKIDDNYFAGCMKFVDEGRRLLSEVRTSCKNEDLEAVDKLQYQLDLLGQRAELKCGEVFEPDRYVDYAQFESQFEGVQKGDLEAFGNRFNEEFRNQVFENVVSRLQEQVLKTMLEKFQQAIEERLKSSFATMLENLAVTNPGISQEVLQNRLQAVDCASSMKQISQRAGGEKLQELIGRIEQATTVGDSASKLQSLCESFVTRASSLKGQELAEVVAEAISNIGSVLTESSQEAVAKGITCFTDVPVDQWYHKEVCGAAKFKIIEGGSKGAEPTRGVNVAELMKITAMVLGEKVESGAKGTEWFVPYCGWAKAKGLSLADECSKNPGRAALRGEVVRAILEGAGVKPESVTNTGFTDVSAKHPHAAYIAQAAAMKLVSGTEKDGKRVFLPDRGVLRAEMARIGKNAFFIFGQPEDDVIEEEENFRPPPPSRSSTRHPSKKFDEEDFEEDDDEFDDFDGDEGEDEEDFEDDEDFGFDDFEE